MKHLKYSETLSTVAHNYTIFTKFATTMTSFCCNLVYFFLFLFFTWTRLGLRKCKYTYRFKSYIFKGWFYPMTVLNVPVSSHLKFKVQTSNSGGQNVPAVLEHFIYLYRANFFSIASCNMTWFSIENITLQWVPCYI